LIRTKEIINCLTAKCHRTYASGSISLQIQAIRILVRLKYRSQLHEKEASVDANRPSETTGLACQIDVQQNFKNQPALPVQTRRTYAKQGRG